MTAPAHTETAHRAALTGILFALGGNVFLSVNDLAVKQLSGAYPLHEVILIRGIIGMAVLLFIINRQGLGTSFLRTRNPLRHLIRITIVLASNIAFFTALAALPMAEAVTISFVAPLFITALSVFMLKERVGPHRWAAVGVGLIGVVVMMRPGAGALQPAALLALGSALGYAFMHVMTRQMKATESAFTLSFYTQSAFILFSITMGLTVGDGRFDQPDSAALSFLLRAWSWPATDDLIWFALSGLTVSLGGLMVTQSYRLAEAALVAPFEYIGIPLAILWGVVIFRQWPDATTWAGIAMICGAGLYVLWRETLRRRIR